MPQKWKQGTFRVSIANQVIRVISTIQDVETFVSVPALLNLIPG